jgi:hypothetical protein
LILLKHLRPLKFLLAFPLFQNIPLTSHDPHGHAVMWTLHCFSFIFIFLVDILWFFCHLNIPCGHAVFWTLLCFSFVFIFLVDMLSRENFIVILIFLVNTLSCGHFLFFVNWIFFVDALSCGHFIVFCYFNIPCGHAVMWTFFVFFNWIFFVDTLSCGHFIIFLILNIRLGHAIWTFYCFSVILTINVDTSLLFILWFPCVYMQNSAIKSCALLQ